MADLVLQVNHVDVVYDSDSGFFRKKPGFHAVKDVSFSIEQGEIMGLVGESGCGKSTLSKAILGMQPYTGEIIHYTKRPQMVFQDPYGSLNPAKTVGWIVEEPLRAFGKYDAKERKRRVADMLDRVGLGAEYALRRPRELSGGQRQRAMIAAAFIIDPKLLLADEPTTALDVTVQAQIIELLKRINVNRGIGILFISHDLHVIRKLCTHVAVMRSGCIVETGPTEEIFHHPQHEYTQRLIAAIPTREKRKRANG